MGLNAAYRIMINGVDMTPIWQVQKRVLEIEVEDKEGESSDHCTIVLDDRFPHVQWPPQGASLRLFLGASPATLTDMGSYVLDAPEASSPPDTLTVRGHAAAYIPSLTGTTPLQTEHSRTWLAVTLADLANTIAVSHGMIARVQPLVGASLVQACEQVDESDLAFLSRIAKQFGARVRVKSSPAGTLLEVVGGGVQPLPPVLIMKRDIEEWSATFGGRIKPGSVAAAWHNPKTGASGVIKAGILEPKVVLSEIFDNAVAAASACKSKLTDKTREAKQVTVKLTHLDPSIMSGTPVVIAGVRSEIDAQWNVVSARHRLTGSTARTSFVAEAMAV